MFAIPHTRVVIFIIAYCILNWAWATCDLDLPQGTLGSGLTLKKLIWNHPPPKKIWLSPATFINFVEKEREIRLYGQTRMRDIPVAKSKKHSPPPPAPPPRNKQTHESFSKEKATRNFVFQTVQRVKSIPLPPPPKKIKNKKRMSPASKITLWVSNNQFNFSVSVCGLLLSTFCPVYFFTVCALWLTAKGLAHVVVRFICKTRALSVSLRKRELVFVIIRKPIFVSTPSR